MNTSENKSNLNLAASRNPVSKSFWQGYLGEQWEATSLQVQKEDLPAEGMSKPMVYSETLSAETSAKINALTKGNLFNVHSVFIAALHVLARKFNSEMTTILGTPIFTTQESDQYANHTIPFRVEQTQDSTFKDIILAVRAHSKASTDHQSYPQILLREEFGGPEGESLFPMVGMVEGFQLLEIAAKVNPEFIFVIKPGAQTHTLAIHVQARIPAFVAKNTLAALVRIMDQAFSNPSGLVRDIAVADFASAENTSYAALSVTEDNLVDVFKRVANTYPDKVALVKGTDTFTYYELDKYSDQIALYLLHQGITCQDIVGVLLDRSFEMIATLLGVLKAGACYAPLDPTHPRDRIQYILEDSQAKLVVTHSGMALAAELDVALVYVNQISTDDVLQTACEHAATDPAYIIYTSGTTGKPKGVVVEHGNLMSLLFHPQQPVAISENDTWVVFHSYCFDFSVWEMYGALLFGGRLVLLDELQARDPAEFVKLVADTEVTILNQTPSAFYNFIAEALRMKIDLPALQKVIFGGEALSPRKLADWHQAYPGVQLINMYGITETTVHVTYKEITSAEIASGASNVGVALPNLSMQLVNADRNALPAGVMGEILVQGAGVTRGYLNKADLTAERFPTISGRKSYLSGDLAMQLESGDLVFARRKDNQVQLRGYRIELGEIEAALLAYPGVTSAVVTIKGEEDSPYLCGYYLAETAVVEAALNEFVSDRVPPYMVPGYFVHLDKLPLNHNGKIDLPKLPEPTRSFAALDLGDLSETANSLLDLWKQNLKQEHLPVDQSYFNIGGDSIRAIRLINSVNTAFGTSIQLKHIYSHDTVLAMAELIDSQAVASADPLLLQAESEIKALEAEVLAAHPDAANLEQVYPMADVQKGMVYYAGLNDEAPLYHDQMVHHVNFPQFDAEAFTKAVDAITAKHEVLRTSFNLDDYAEPVQLVHKSVPVDLDFVDLKAMDSEAATATVRQAILDDRKDKFIPEEAPLWRIKVFLLDEDNVVLLWVCHHAIIDGWSDASFKTELHLLYDLYKQGKTVEASKLASSYRDYVTAERAAKANVGIRDFWKQELVDYNHLKLTPSFDKNETLQLQAHHVSLGTELFDQVHQYCEVHAIAPKSFFFSAYLLTLQTQSFENNFLAGYVTHNRPTKEDGDKILGCFLNTLPFQYRRLAGETYESFLQGVHQKLNSLREYDALSLIEIMRIVDLQVSDGNPFFDTLFNFVDFHVYEGMSGEDNRVEAGIQDGYTNTNTLLDFTVSNTTGEFELVVNFAANLMDPQRVANLAGYFQTIISKMLHDSAAEIDNVDVLSPSEKNFLSQINHPDEHTSLAPSVPEAFGRMVEQHRTRPAVSFGDTTLSYGELDALSEHVKNYLQSLDLVPGELVGLHLQRSEQIAMLMLGVLKAGYSYLPLDTHMPQSRKDYVVADSGIRVLLTDTPEQIDFAFAGQVVDSKTIAETTVSEGEEVALSPDLPAYVIYTSGTTGKPKGVNITQGNLMHLMAACEAEYTYDEQDIWMMFHSYNFDFTVWEMYGALLSGGKVVICQEESRADSSKFAEEIAREQITMLSQTPSSFYNLLQYSGWEDTLRYVVFGGESLAFERIRDWHASNPEVALVNMYGITETTVHTSYKRLSTEDFAAGYSNIGKPLNSHRYLILNEQQQLQAPGTIGELYVGGPCVSNGYLNMPEKTAERFIAHPYQAAERLYRTGDLVRLHSNLELEYIGRCDGQIQLRGYRIELGEIAAALDTHSAVSGSHVMLRDRKDGDSYLCAYYVSAEPLDAADLREHIASQLPSYMLPSYYVHLSELPLTINGKINVKALPLPDVKADDEHELPSNETETALLEIWSEILDHPQESISVTKNFFELGGHSLSVAVLSTKIGKRFGQKLPLAAVFKHPTIRQQAIYLHDDEGVADTTQPAITRAAEAKRYPLSGVQQRLYLLQEMTPESTVYNMPFMMPLPETDMGEKVADILQQLQRRHESLRTRFYQDGDAYYQEILDAVPLHIVHKTWDGESADELLKGFVKPFDLSSTELVRCLYLTGYEGKGDLLLLDMHHIISDGLSQSILQHEFATLYAGGTLSAPALRYVDYAVYQQSEAWKGQMERENQYWEDTLTGDLPHLDMPLDRFRPRVQDHRHGVITTYLGEDLMKQVRAYAEREGVTTFMVLLSLWKVLLSRYSKQEELLVGIPVSGRRHEGLEDIVGMFVNTLVIRSFPEQEKPFHSFLQEVKETVVGAYDHQDYPFDELVKRKQVQRDLSRHPLVDVMIGLQELDQLETGAEKVDHEAGEAAKCDLIVNMFADEKDCQLNVFYASALFAQGTMEQLVEQFKHLLTEAMAYQEQKIGLLPLQSVATRDAFLDAFNDTASDFNKDQTIAQLFEAQVAANPQAVALRFQGQAMTYTDLNAKANQVAHYLISQGILRGDVVALFLDRSFDQIISIMGVIKAGATYLPFEPGTPLERVQYIYDDAKAKLVLTDEDHPWEGEQVTPVAMADVMAMDSLPVGNPGVEAASSDTLYIIYTSGTTGKPKGTLINHFNVNRVVRHTNYVHLTPEDKMFQLSSYSFDGSIFDIFGGLLNGGEVHLVRKQDILDLPRLAKYIQESGVSSFFVTAALFNALVDFDIHCLGGVRQLLVGGEALSVEYVSRFLAAHGPGKLINGYGPTESCVFAVCHAIDNIDEDFSSIPIGSAIGNTQLYVLDQHNQIAAPGIPGELCIAGDGLSDGYLNNPELTAEKFQVVNIAGVDKRVYRTGDLVKWSYKSELIYFGRNDRQVKIRGFRIELPEIEKHLVNHPLVRNGVVNVDTSTGYKRIAAYFVSDEELSHEAIASHLQQFLPEYMIPNSFMQLETIPRNKNGKVDYRSLPIPTGSATQATEVDMDATQRQLQGLFADVLNLPAEEIGLDDGFFQLGGHSLNAAILGRAIENTFGVEFPLIKIFELQTIQAVSTYLQTADPTKLVVRLPKTELQAQYPLSSSQKRIFAVLSLDPANVSYNMPRVSPIDPAWAHTDIEKVLNQLILRHESLRIGFGYNEAGEAYQAVAEGSRISLGTTQSDASVKEITGGLIKPFDLAQPPLIRAEVIESPEGKHLFLDANHIIVDGYSLGILQKEFETLMTGGTLPDKEVQYHDYLAWMTSPEGNQQLDAQRAFWRDYLGSGIYPFQLPYDFDKGSTQPGLEDDALTFTLEGDAHQALLRLCEDQGLTTFMVLLATWNVLMAKLSGSEQVTVGVPVFGRTQLFQKDLIGMFVNYLPVTTQPGWDKVVMDYLGEVKNHAVQAIHYQDIQYEEIVEMNQEIIGSKDEELFSVVFNFLSIKDQEYSASQTEVARSSKVDILLSASEYQNAIMFEMEYSTGLFAKESVEYYQEEFLSILNNLLENPASTIAELSQDLTSELEDSLY